MANSYSVKAFKAISNGALSGPELPSRLKVLDWGINHVCDGSTVELNDKTAEVFSANQRNAGRTEVALDYNHCTCKSAPEYKVHGDKPSIFAYGKPLLVPGDGLYLDSLQWTPYGKQHARNVKDISPAVAEQDGVVIALDSVALTPTGAINDLHFYTPYSSADDLLSNLKVLSENMDTPNAFKVADKSYQLLTNMDARIKEFAKELGLPDTSTEADVKKHVDGLMAKWEGITHKEGPLNRPAAGIEPDANKRTGPPGVGDLSQTQESYRLIYAKADEIAEAKVRPLAAKLEALENFNKTEQTKAEKQQRQNIITLAAKDGKVIPFSKETIEAMPISTLQECVDKLPVQQVPTTPKVLFTGDGKPARALSADGKAIRATRMDSVNGWEDWAKQHGMPVKQLN